MSTVVVTGGTRGIGGAISAELAAEGHHVIALATTEPPVPLDGIDVRICDVTDEQQVAAVFSDIGAVDVLVNNAGVSGSNRLGRTTLEEWNRSMSVNATGAFLCTRAVIDRMLERNAGKIVTVASIAGVEGAPYIAAYAASKHAVMGLMRVVAAEVAGTGVTVNSVCPTFVRTEMTVATIANIAERTGKSLADAEAALATATPHGRIIEIAEVVDAVMELLAGDLSGQEIVLDGGPS
ncbi:MAG: SDR family oxidoreductase [Acidimicrobiales bacterium]|nr:SDR family oxidoreductase [Acidimicrobiales bacterium]MYB81089.1 SDR family oxidoreductase [Acidimicrobiales bacterium]MYI13044.1 SDR family oxidoreductase [Acidimicrobiales bacterium]